MASSIMFETWLPVTSYANYLVSDCGRVMNANTGLILKAQRRAEYLGVRLCDSRSVRNLYIHRLVVEAFVGTIPGDHEVNHMDGDKYNNQLENLEIVTGSENVRHAFSTGLTTPASKRVVCLETGVVFLSIRAAGRWAGTTADNVSKSIKYGWRAGGYTFRFVDEEAL